MPLSVVTFLLSCNLLDLSQKKKRCLSTFALLLLSKYFYILDIDLYTFHNIYSSYSPASCETQAVLTVGQLLLSAQSMCCFSFYLS